VCLSPAPRALGAHWDSFWTCQNPPDRGSSELVSARVGVSDSAGNGHEFWTLQDVGNNIRPAGGPSPSRQTSGRAGEAPQPPAREGTALRPGGGVSADRRRPWTRDPTAPDMATFPDSAMDVSVRTGTARRPCFKGCLDVGEREIRQLEGVASWAVIILADVGRWGGGRPTTLYGPG
jgi:hypothetical protein